MKQILAFLIASFFSSLGDALLYFVLPLGFGLETGDLRYSVVLFIVPAISIYLSTFLEKRIRRRIQQARTDYARILFLIFIIELLIAGLSSISHAHIVTFTLLVGFVFFYAFAKEGVPRLLYVVSVYDYFCEAADYKKISGIHHGVSILAKFLGTILAAFLVANGSWRFALIFDAFTFFLLGLALTLFGKDPKPCENHSEPKADAPSNSIPQKKLSPSYMKIMGFISFIVPLEVGITSLFWPYLPMISEKFALLSVFNSLSLMAVLQVPGLLLGLFFGQITKRIKPIHIVFIVPTVFIALSVGFIAVPSVVTLSLLLLSQGLMEGIYWPADYSLRNELPSDALIQFNASVLKKFALYQILGSVLALVVFSAADIHKPLLICVVGLIAVAIFTSKIFQIKSTTPIILRIQKYFPITIILISVLFIGCFKKEILKPFHIEIPSISTDLRITSELTYAEAIILNETSAHLVTLTEDLSVRGQVLKKSAYTESGRKYDLILDNTYKSFRGERITSEDLEFTIKYYISHHSNLAGPLLFIQGAKKCKSATCHLPGLKVIDGDHVAITLTQPTRRFIADLVTPGFVMLKKDRPLEETVGECLIPYQTGTASIISCTKNQIEVKVGDRIVAVTKAPLQKTTTPKASNTASLLSENQLNETYLSLSVLSVFANPSSKQLSEQVRFEALRNIRARAAAVSKSLRLEPAYLSIPEWLGVEAPSKLKQISWVKMKSCPVRPIKILLDTSVPNIPLLKQGLSDAISCPVEFTLTTSDRYFELFRQSDLGVLWFTPSYLSAYDLLAVFDCNPAAICYFNWKDATLQSLLNQVRSSSAADLSENQAAILKAEQVLFEKGYMAPISAMNWWIQSGDKIKPIHPAGLFQVRLGDFL